MKSNEAPQQYIKKSALVAEIERRKNLCEKILLDLRTKENIDYYQGEAEAYKVTIDLLNTLEVKEVDLEEEIKEVQRDYKTIEEYEGYPCTMYANGIEWIARHFFELGMAVSNKA